MASLLVALASGPAAASPADLFGAGARSIGRAGTGAADSESSAAAYLNPALLGGPGPKALRLGYRAASFALEAEVPEGLRSHGDASAAVELGLRVPLQLAAPLTDRLGLGLDVSTPGSVLSRVTILDPTRGQFPLLAGRADALNFSLGLGAELPLDLRVGLGLLAQASVTGTVAIGAGGSGVVESRVADDLALVTAPVVGLAYDSGPWAFGAVYRGELRSDFDLDVTIGDLGRLVLPPLSVVGMAQYDPEQLQLEAQLELRSFTFVVGLTFERWSELAGLRGPTLVCPADDADCSQPEVPALDAHDIVVPRVAVTRSIELRAGVEAQLSLGYFHEPSPLPPQRGATNLWDNPRHVLSLGYHLASTAPAFGVHLGVQRHFLSARVHRKAEPADELGGAYRDVRTSGGVWVSNLELEVPF